MDTIILLNFTDTVVALHHHQEEDLHLHAAAHVQGLVLVVQHEDVGTVAPAQVVLVNWSSIIELLSVLCIMRGLLLAVS